MSYGDAKVRIFAKVLNLKDINPAIQGMILKLTPQQYLVPSNVRTSQIKWAVRSAELTEATLDLLIEHITQYEASVKTSNRYYVPYSVSILTKAMTFSAGQIQKLSEAGLMPHLLSGRYISFLKLDAATQKTILHNLMDNTVKEAGRIPMPEAVARPGQYTPTSGYNPYTNRITLGASSLAGELTLEQYEYLRNYAEDAKKNLKPAAAKLFQEAILDDEICKELPEDTNCSLDIVEKYGNVTVRELLLRLRTQPTLQLAGVKVDQEDNVHETLIYTIRRVMRYTQCPIDYLKKIVNCAELTEEDTDEIYGCLLELARTDLTQLQLELMLEDPKMFLKRYKNDYHGREVFWQRFVQVIQNNQAFAATFKAAMLDTSTLALPAAKGAPHGEDTYAGDN